MTTCPCAALCRAVLCCACSWRPSQTSRTQRLPLSSSSSRKTAGHEQQPCCAEAATPHCSSMFRKVPPFSASSQDAPGRCALGLVSTACVLCGMARVDPVVCPLWQGGDTWVANCALLVMFNGFCRSTACRGNVVPSQALSCTVLPPGSSWHPQLACVRVRPQTRVVESRTAASLHSSAGQQPAHLVLPTSILTGLCLLEGCVFWRPELRVVLVWAGRELATSACKSSAV